MYLFSYKEAVMEKRRIVKLAITVAVASATSAFAAQYNTTITGTETDYESIRTLDENGIVSYTFAQDDQVVISQGKGDYMSGVYVSDNSPDTIKIKQLDMSVTGNIENIQGILFAGLENDPCKTLVLENALLTVKNTSEKYWSGASAVLVENGQKSTLQLDGTFMAVVENITTKPRNLVEAYGIYTNNGTDTSINDGNIDLTINSTSPYYALSYGIDLSGSNDRVTTDGFIKIVATSEATESAEAVGISANGNDVITVGDIDISTTATGGSGCSVYSKGILVSDSSAAFTTQGSSIKVTANGDPNLKLEAVGIYAGNSVVNVGNVDIITQANAAVPLARNASGSTVSSIGIESTRGASVTLAGGSITASVTGTTDVGKAYGAYANSNGIIKISSAGGVNITATTSATEGKGVGLFADGGSIEYFGGEITASHYAIQSNADSKVSLSGKHTKATGGQYGIYAEGGHVEVINGAVVEANSVLNKGEISVTNATLVTGKIATVKPATGKLAKKQQAGKWSVTDGFIEFGSAIEGDMVNLATVVASGASTLKFGPGTIYSIGTFTGDGTTIEVSSLDKNTIRLPCDPSTLTVTASASLGNSFASEAAFANAIASVVTKGT